MLKQKIVMRVDKMNCDNCQKKCRKLAAVADGCISMTIEAEKSHLIITGVGIDVASLAKSLSKKVGPTSIVSIDIIKTPAQAKEDEIKKQAKELLEQEAKKKKTLKWIYKGHYNNSNCNYSYPPPPPQPPYGYDMVCYGAPNYPNSWFTNW